jgi:hypothetical protein
MAEGRDHDHWQDSATQREPALEFKAGKSRQVHVDQRDNQPRMRVSQ